MINIAVGYFAGQNVTTGANNIEIGNQAAQRKTFIAGISGATVSDGAAVMINSKGQLGVTTSSALYKEAIEPMKEASEAILSLEPVTFHYKKELDPDGIPQFGLVAEEVEKVNPDLVARDAQGKVYTVRYEAVNAMLLNEFLKEHRKVEEQAHRGREQEATIAQLKSAIAQQHKDFQSLKAALKEQAAQLQKVSDQLKLSSTAPRVVASNQ
jgi:hypothetical protein